MAQNILSDVSTCLRDAMDTMFNNDPGNIMSANNIINSTIPSNGGGLSSVEALKSIVNKRKLTDQDFINEERIYQENGDDNTKRLCQMDSYQQEQKT